MPGAKLRVNDGLRGHDLEGCGEGERSGENGETLCVSRAASPVPFDTEHQPDDGEHQQGQAISREAQEERGDGE